MDKESLAVEEFNSNLIFLYKSADEKLQVFALIMIKQYNKASSEDIRKALRETATWYSNCLNKAYPPIEEKQGSYMLLKEYNKHTHDLQIMYVPSKQKYIISLDRGITSFGNELAMFDFLRDIGYSEEELAKEGEITIVEI